MKAIIATAILLGFLLQASSASSISYKCAFLNTNGYYDFSYLAASR